MEILSLKKLPSGKNGNAINKRIQQHKVTPKSDAASEPPDKPRPSAAPVCQQTTAKIGVSTADQITPTVLDTISIDNKKLSTSAPFPAAIVLPNATTELLEHAPAPTSANDTNPPTEDAAKDTNPPTELDGRRHREVSSKSQTSTLKIASTSLNHTWTGRRCSSACTVVGLQTSTVHPAINNTVPWQTQRWGASHTGHNQRFFLKSRKLNMTKVARSDTIAALGVKFSNVANTHASNKKVQPGCLTGTAYYKRPWKHALNETVHSDQTRKSPHEHASNKTMQSGQTVKSPNTHASKQTVQSGQTVKPRPPGGKRPHTAVPYTCAYVRTKNASLSTTSSGQAIRKGWAPIVNNLVLSKDKYLKQIWEIERQIGTKVSAPGDLDATSLATRDVIKVPTNTDDESSVNGDQAVTKEGQDDVLEDGDENQINKLDGKQDGQMDCSQCDQLVGQHSDRTDGQSSDRTGLQPRDPSISVNTRDSPTTDSTLNKGRLSNITANARSGPGTHVSRSYIWVRNASSHVPRLFEIKEPGKQCGNSVPQYVKRPKTAKASVDLSIVKYKPCPSEQPNPTHSGRPMKTATKLGASKSAMRHRPIEYQPKLAGLLTAAMAEPTKPTTMSGSAKKICDKQNAQLIKPQPSTLKCTQEDSEVNEISSAYAINVEKTDMQTREVSVCKSMHSLNMTRDKGKPSNKKPRKGSNYHGEQPREQPRQTTSAHGSRQQPNLENEPQSNLKVYNKRKSMVSAREKQVSYVYMHGQSSNAGTTPVLVGSESSVIYNNSEFGSRSRLTTKSWSSKWNTNKGQVSSSTNSPRWKSGTVNKKGQVPRSAASPRSKSGTTKGQGPMKVNSPRPASDRANIISGVNTVTDKDLNELENDPCTMDLHIQPIKLEPKENRFNSVPKLDLHSIINDCRSSTPGHIPGDIDSENFINMFEYNYKRAVARRN